MAARSSAGGAAAAAAAPSPYITGAAVPPPPLPSMYATTGAAGAAGAAVTAGATPGAAGSVRAGDVDIALVFDGTGSMAPYCHAVRDAVAAVTDRVSRRASELGADIKWAAAAYKDFDPGAKPRQGDLCPGAAVVTDFGGPAEIQRAIKGYQFDGGADLCEDVYSGVIVAQRLGWRRHSVRALVLLLDAPPHGVHHMLPDRITAEEMKAYDNYLDGSPTGGSLREALDALIVSHEIQRVFVVWCYDTRSTLGDKFAEACFQLLYPATSVPPGARTPVGFFELKRDNASDVAEQLAAALCETCLGSIAMKAGGGAAAEAAVRRVLDSTPVGVLSLPSTDSRTFSVTSASTEAIRDLVARNLATSTQTSLVTTRSKELGVLAPSAVALGPATGQGPFGTIYQGSLTKYGDGKAVVTPCSIKAVQIQFESTKEGEQPVASDLAELKSLLEMGRSGRRGVVRFHGWTRPSAATRDLLGRPRDGRRWILLVMQHYVKDLAQALTERRLSDAEWIIVAEDIVSGLFWLHKAGRTATDLKPTNIMLSEDNRGVIADLSAVAKLSGATTPTATGAEGFADPALVSRATPPSVSTDMFAYGRTVAAILSVMTSPPPFLQEIVSQCTAPTGRPAAQIVMAKFKAAPRFVGGAAGGASGGAASGAAGSAAGGAFVAAAAPPPRAAALVTSKEGSSHMPPAAAAPAFASPFIAGASAPPAAAGTGASALMSMSKEAYDATTSRKA